MTLQPDGKHISYGEDFQKVARKCYDMNPQQLVAVGANCLAPSLVEGLFKGINKGREHNPVPLIVYPNSGEKYNAQLGYVTVHFREKSNIIIIIFLLCLTDGLTETSVNLWTSTSRHG